MYKKLILGIQNQDKKNLKRVAWGLDVGQEDRTRIKSLMFAFAYFLRFISFLASILFNAIHICFSVYVDIIFRSYRSTHTTKTEKQERKQANTIFNEV